jgi:hypothetical protein
MEIRLSWRSALLFAVLFIAPQPPARSQVLHQARPPSERKLPRYKNTAPGVDYVGSKTCARCHAGIYNGFIKMDMGHSVSSPDDPAQLTLAASARTPPVPTSRPTTTAC